MALPQQLQGGLTPSEIEFRGEEVLITVVPSFRAGPLHLISGTFGPFLPLQQVQLPLWLAMTLIRRGRCRLITPTWLTVPYLLKRLEEETSQPNFSPLPSRYVEVSQVLLDGARESIPQVGKVRRMLQELRELRLAKARLGLRTLDGHYLQLDGLSNMEINEMRPVVIESFKVLQRLEGSSDTSYPSHPQQPSSSSVSASSAFLSQSLSFSQSHEPSFLSSATDLINPFAPSSSSSQDPLSDSHSLGQSSLREHENP